MKDKRNKNRLRSLTDAEYENLKEFAGGKNMTLCGYQATGGGILLNNSVKSGVFGKSMSQLRESILIATT